MIAARRADGVDRDGLIAALAIAPSTYSRNKYPTLYADEAAMRTRRRARILRSLARQLAASPGGVIERQADGTFVVRIEIPELSYRRSATLSQLERDLVVYLSARLIGEPPGEELARVESAIARLSIA